MGMFDTIHVKCPGCQTTVEVQSKAGKCRLKNYHTGAVPVSIAASLDGTTEDCPSCGVTLKFTAYMPPRVVVGVDLVTPEDEDWD
jgi:hypothetical protein